MYGTVDKKQEQEQQQLLQTASVIAAQMVFAAAMMSQDPFVQKLDDEDVSERAVKIAKALVVAVQPKEDW